VIRSESPESDITAISRIRTSGSFRLIHIDEYGVYQARVLQTVIETLGGWGHFSRFALYNRAPMRGVAYI
jgi:hypothetical protein